MGAGPPLTDQRRDDSRQRPLHDPDTLRRLVHNLPAAVYVTNREGDILDANPAFLRLFGVRSLDELATYRAGDLFSDPRSRDEELELRGLEALLDDLPSPQADALSWRFRSIILYAERHQAAERNTDTSLAHLVGGAGFRPNIVADPAEQLGAILSLRGALPLPASLRLDLATTTFLDGLIRVDLARAPDLGAQPGSGPKSAATGGPLSTHRPDPLP